MSAASTCPNCGLPRFWGPAGYVGAQCTCGQFSPHGSPELTPPPIWDKILPRIDRYIRPIVPVEPDEVQRTVVTKACLHEMLKQRGVVRIPGNVFMIEEEQLHGLLRELGVNLE